MLQQGDVLKTWALSRQPDHAEPMVAEALPDHRSIYLDYEGPVSGGRGDVTRWDQGEFHWIGQSPDELTLSLSGNRLRGKAVLTRTDHDNAWQFRFERRAVCRP